MKGKKLFTIFLITAIIVSQFFIPINTKAYGKVINDWDSLGTLGFSEEGQAWFSYLELDNNGVPYIIFQDKANQQKATVMKYNNDNSTWELVGAAGFSDGLARYTTIAFDSSNTPYVAYTDGDTYKATVKRFDGTNWIDVGSPRFSTGNVGYIKIAFNGVIPHLIYKDYVSGKALVMQYSSRDGWVPFAGASDGISDGEVDYTDIEIINNGDGLKYYAAYKDLANGDGITVKQNDGSFSFNWPNVGTPGFSDGEVEYGLDLELDKDGIPYVAFVDVENGYEITVMKYNGSEWEVIGTKGFSEDGDPNTGAEKPSFEINDDGDIYLSTIHDVYSDSFIVYKYTSSNSTWNKLGTHPITNSSTSHVSLDLDSENVVYVGFGDGRYDFKVSVMKYSDPDDRTINSPYISGIEPIIGETPVTYIETSQYTGTVTWSPNDSNFDYEKVYTATISLTPKLGYKLEGITENFFDLVGAVTTTNDANSGLVTGEFPITYANWNMVGDSFTDEYTSTLSDGDNFYLGDLDIAVDNQGIPYVGFVYQINTDGWKSAVTKYENNQWIDLDSETLPLNNYEYIQIEIGSDDNPIIAYYDKLGDLGNIDVRKWDGESWQILGNTSKVGASSPGNFVLKASGENTYITYSDWEGDPYGSASVIEYRDSEWVNIGDSITSGSAFDLSLDIDRNGNPYISYIEEGTTYKFAVQKYDEGNWETIKEYQDGEVDTYYYNDIAVDSTNTPYAAYKDPNNNNEITVEKYNQTNWNIIGNQGFTDDGNENSPYILDLEIDSNDNPILGIQKNTLNEEYVYKYKSNQWIPLRSEYFTSGLYDISLDTYLNKGYLTYSKNDGTLWHGYLLEYTPTYSDVTPPTPSSRPSIPKLEIETEELPEGIQGETYEYHLKGDGGKKPYSWKGSGLPEGLEISQDGKISGTPEESGNFNVKVELLDSRNYYRSKMLKLFIEEVQTEIEEPENETPEEAPDFTDIQRHWISGYIAEIVDRNIISGYPDSTFRPNNKVSRGEFAALIIRTFVIEPIEGNLFDDTSDNWAESSINGAVVEGIITGYEDNTFRPNAPITREEMAVMISRALNIEEEVVEDYFEDIGTASPWAVLSIKRLGNSKILSGFPDGTFRPKDTLTRAEAVKVIYEILQDLDQIQ